MREPPKRVDFLLRYRRDFPLAVVEAKASYRTAAGAVQQARLYAEMLGLKFAYATNGPDIIATDYFTETETPRDDYPTTGELWSRYRAGSGLADEGSAHCLLAPGNHVVGKGERYHQLLAITYPVICPGKSERIPVTSAPAITVPACST